MFFAFPGHVYYATPSLIAPKPYANTILVVLNSRFQILGAHATYISTSDMTNITFLRPGETGTSGGRSNAYNKSSPSVAINKEVFTDGNGENLEMKAIHVSKEIHGKVQDATVFVTISSSSDKRKTNTQARRPGPSARNLSVHTRIPQHRGGRRSLTLAAAVDATSEMSERYITKPSEIFVGGTRKISLMDDLSLSQRVPAQELFVQPGSPSR
ncbi:hypothetical protein C8J57DRAFT_1213386 [Mycena rebaudengoi]|nr:hypothetical protein C8J57DRAFT_1213386 [Mycena rebaudengoi]